MENDIRLPKSNVLRLRITDDTGKPTGNYLEFDFEDMELLLRYQELQEKDRKNRDWLKKEIIIINKREDIKGKKFLSKNEEDIIKARNKFFIEEAKVYNMFLGENGVEKLLNGRKFGFRTLEKIDEIIKEQILPFIEKKTDEMEKEIMNKYKEENEEVI